MQILVDADGLPKMIREILFRAAERVKVKLSMVCNTALKIPESVYIALLLVPEGPDAADHKIVELALPGDLVITSDIPLAARAVEKGSAVIGLRGELYTKDNVKQRLTMRNFMSDLRDSGVETGGPSIYRPKDKLAFANALNGWLTKNVPQAEK